MRCLELRQCWWNSRRKNSLGRSKLNRQELSRASQRTGNTEARASKYELSQVDQRQIVIRARSTRERRAQLFAGKGTKDSSTGDYYG